MKSTYNCLHCGEEKPSQYQTTNKYCDNDCFQASRKAQRRNLVEQGKASAYKCKKYLIEKHGNKCMVCSWSEVNPVTGTVPIDLEHIDGNHANNNLNNLKLLCPNCHSLTPTYKALNKGNGRKR